MKIILKTISIVTIVSLLLIACSGSDKRNSNFLPPLRIEIPNEISGDVELVDMIKSSEKAMNEFSDNIEQLAIDGKDVLSKKKEDQTLMDGLKAGKLMLQFVSNSTQMLASAEKFNTYIESKKSQDLIDDTKLKALEKVAKAFTKRTDEINEKYKNYFDK